MITAINSVPYVYRKISYLGQKLFDFKSHCFEHVFPTQQWNSVGATNE